jgi:tetratricopeptide (TPR) repeat protein
MGREPGEPGSIDEDPSGAVEATDSWISASDQSGSVGASVAQAYISQELFGKGGRSFGRFVLRRPLGSGGMGVVYEAHDPELHREVALKLVPVPADGAEGALTEARALARLAHPNVVPIYDVGVDGAYVYLVMELVRGETLKRWVRDRKPREVVKAYLQAGEALAAAHDQGVVHRDFKPANAIMGADGRVRVVDFGLAFQVADGPTEARQPRVAGTPRYMAPEQAAGGPVTAASDQFSFCVSLAEAFGATPESPRTTLPRWLDRIVARGTAPTPAARFPTMRALLKELANDPVTVWRRRALVSSLIAASATAFVAGRATLAARDPACAGIPDRLATAWGAPGRTAALARLAGLGPYGQSLQPLLTSHLDDHARRWIGGYEDACVAHRREIQSDAVFDRRVSCLERGRAGLKSFAEIVASSDAKDLPAVALALQAIPDPDACNDVSSLDTDVEPPPPAIAKEVARLRNDVGEARVQVAAGRFENARTIAEKTATAARTLGYRPLLAEALLVEGHAALSMRLEAARPLLAEAAQISFETGPRSLAIEAWARRAWVDGNTNGQASALAGVDIVEAVASNPSTGRFARAVLHNNIGSVELALEHRERARTVLERALEEAQGVKGPGAVELVSVRFNLAMATDDQARRDEVLADEERAMAALVGDDHPETLRIRKTRASLVPRFKDALNLLEPTCSLLETHDRNRATECWSDVGYLRGELNDAPAAVSAFRRAKRMMGADAPSSLETEGYLLFWEGAPERATGQFAKALAEQPKDDAAAAFWIRLEVARLELGMGRAQRAAGHTGAARRTLSASLATLLDVAKKHPDTAIDRLIGRARAELAKTLVATGAGRGEVSEAARPAVIWLEKAGGDPTEIRQLERLILAESAPRR